MISRQPIALRLFLWSVLSVVLFGSTAETGPSAELPPGRRKEIADLEKQIQDLTKRLNDLKQQGPTPTPVPADGSLNPDWLKTLTWRSIGPASMGGRITALAVCEADPTTYWVATASGGLLKTINNGVTFEHQFDRESTVSIGAVCVAPSDRNIVWVGSGENNPRNSVSYGDGVYKSIDGGKIWKNMGLKKSFQIGQIAIHPKDPNTVYVGALGRLYGLNEERGLFKSTDGGKTWEKVLFIDDKTGVIDVQMHPADPNTLLVATWERQRDEFDSYQGQPPPPEGFSQYDPIKKNGPGSGLYKTTDGGKTFRKLTKGLPTCALGRIGIDYYRKDPNVVFAVIDSERIGMGPPQAQGPSGYLGINGQDADAGARVTQVVPKSPADKAGLKVGDIILSIDKKAVLAFKQFTELVAARKPGDKLAFQISRNREGKEIVVELGKRPGGDPKRPFAGYLGGQKENLQTKQGPDGFQYGGIYKSSDGGDSWSRVNSLNPRPMYFSQVRVDPNDDKIVYVLGINLHRSADGGQTFKDDAGKGVHPDHHALWIDPRDGRHMIVGGDGGFYVTYDRAAHWDYLNHMALGQFYHVAVDHRQPYHVYGGLQDNGSWAGPSRTLRSTGPINEDWYLIGGGDGFVCRVDPHDPDVVYGESQDGNIYRRNLRTGRWGRVRPKEAPGGAHRFNWNTPFILSHHNSRNSLLHRQFCLSLLPARRRTAAYLAGDYPHQARLRHRPGRIAPQPRCSLGRQRRRRPVGDARDGGGKWTSAIDKVGLPGPRWVASIEASRFVDGRAYVVFDAHRSNDDEPYVYVTEDFGQTWKSLRANLPTGSTRVLREDVHNPNLLYLGTEFAVWVSVDRGQKWEKLNNNLPTVAVHEIAAHPTAGEIVAPLTAAVLGAGRDALATDDFGNAEVPGLSLRTGAGNPLAFGTGEGFAVRHGQPPFHRPESAARGHAFLFLDEES